MANVPFHFIRSVFNNTVLDIENGDCFPGGRVIAYDKNFPPSPNQLWRFEDVGDGRCVITSAADPNLVLDIEGGVNQAGTQIIVYERSYPPTDNQLFIWNNGIIQSCMPGNLVLDLEGGTEYNTNYPPKIIIYDYHGNVNQQWAIDHV